MGTQMFRRRFIKHVAFGWLAYNTAQSLCNSKHPTAFAQLDQNNSEELPSKMKLSFRGVEVELVLIPAGKFLMGSRPTETGHRPQETPVRTISISKPFYLSKFEITQAQYVAVMGSHMSNFHGDGLAMDQVSYTRAISFCEKLSDLVKKKVTLPTEAQWEYACRAGTKTRFYTGDSEDELSKAAWYEANSNETVHAVGLKQANAFGLYDMLGNVWEHCLDVLPAYETIAEVDPVGEVYADRGTMRGGAWMYDADFCRAACSLATSDRFGGAGIRIAVNVD